MARATSSRNHFSVSGVGFSLGRRRKELFPENQLAFESAVAQHLAEYDALGYMVVGVRRFRVQGDGALKILDGFVEFQIVEVVVGPKSRSVLRRGRSQKRGQRQDESTHAFMVTQHGAGHGPAHPDILRIVLLDGLKLLLDVWRRPAATMGAVLDRGSALFALLAALAASWLLASLTPPMLGVFMPVIVLALAYVPGTLMLGVLTRSPGWLGSGLRARLLAPADVRGHGMGGGGRAAGLGGVGGSHRGVSLARRRGGALLRNADVLRGAHLFGVPGGVAAGIVGLSWAPLLAMAFLWGTLRYLLDGWRRPSSCFTPGTSWAGSWAASARVCAAARAFTAVWRRPPSIRTMAMRQYQLGLIHQQRRQIAEAAKRFRNAVAIDPEATDAHFQLGRIARQQGRLDDAWLSSRPSCARTANTA